MGITHDNVQTQEQSSEIESTGKSGFSPPVFSLMASSIQNQNASSSTAPLQLVGDPEVEHQGRVGMEPGDIGPATGYVTARSNVELNDTYTNTYEIGYEGMNADDAHWLQFVKFEMRADVPDTEGPVYNTGNVPTSSGNKPYSTPDATSWTVDSANNSSPFYDVTFAGSRDPGVGVKIFDAAGGPSWLPMVRSFVAGDAAGTSEVVFTATFHTYLVIGTQVNYRVSYSTTTRYAVTGSNVTTVGDWEHDTLGAGNAGGLPENLKEVLDDQYPDTGIN